MNEKVDAVEAQRKSWIDGDIAIEPPSAVDAAFSSRGIVASAAVVAREGRVVAVLEPERAVARLLGDDGLGKAFDALVASGQVSHTDLIATAVERSHEYYNVPAILASGEARAWVRTLSDEAANSIDYHGAARAFEEQQAEAIVASARVGLRKRVIRGRVSRG